MRGVKKDVVVNVIGVCNSGKTTVAAQIEKILKSYGFEVEYTDPDDSYASRFTDDEIRMVAKDIRVKINEVPLRRDTFLV